MIATNMKERIPYQKIWSKHAKNDLSSVAADEAFKNLSDLEEIDPSSVESKKKHAELSRLALVLGKSAALKTAPKEASFYLQEAIKVLLERYPISDDESEARKRGENWEGMVIENQSSQIICLRDMLSLLDFVSEVAPSEEINYLTQQILILLLEVSEKRPSDIFALISLIEKASYNRAVESFKIYSEKYCKPELGYGLDQIITVSTRFLERSIKEQDAKGGILALENILKVLLKDKSFVKRIALDTAKAVFPNLRDKIVTKAALGIRKEKEGKENLNELIQTLLKLSYVSVGDGEIRKL